MACMKNSGKIWIYRRQPFRIDVNDTVILGGRFERDHVAN